MVIIKIFVSGNTHLILKESWLIIHALSNLQISEELMKQLPVLNFTFF